MSALINALGAIAGFFEMIVKGIAQATSFLLSIPGTIVGFMGFLPVPIAIVLTAAIAIVIIVRILELLP